MSTSDQLREIFDLEVSRLLGLARDRPLYDEEVKKLDMLTRSWKTYNATQEPHKETEDMQLSDEELLAIARKE